MNWKTKLKIFKRRFEFKFNLPRKEPVRNGSFLIRYRGNRLFVCYTGYWKSYFKVPIMLHLQKGDKHFYFDLHPDFGFMRLMKSNPYPEKWITLWEKKWYDPELEKLMSKEK